MIIHNKLLAVYFSAVICLSLAGAGYLADSNNSVQPHVAQATKTNLLKTSRAHSYRVYSHHYLTAEKADLGSLTHLYNGLASHTNNVYEQRFNGSSPLYTKFHDHNYWSIFKYQPVPNNYRHSHMSNQMWQIIQHRVLRSHGVYSGVNFHNQKKLNSTEI